jgi:aspartate/methionine/tyrosine aminotransferase
MYPLFLSKLLIRTGLARWLPAVRRRLGGSARWLHHWSDRLLATPMGELERIAAAMTPPSPEVIDLTPGSPRFDLLPSSGTKLPADRRGWPPVGGLPELRQAVAEKLGKDHCLEVDPADEVIITAGALGAVQTIFDAFVDRGDRVLLLDPTSPLYILAATAQRARMRWLTTWVDSGRTRIRFDRLIPALRGARLLVLTSPCNPTGGILAAEDLEQIAWWAERYDVLLLSDESFERYHHEGELVSIGTLPRARQRTLTVGSMSKGHALAWARVGWVAAPRDLLRPCVLTAALRCPFVPMLSQQVALAALRTGPDAFEPIRAGFESRRQYTFERLRAMDLHPAWPAGAFFVWVPVWQLGVSGRSFAEGLLQDRKVMVVPGDLFGPSGLGYVRLSYAVEDGRLHEGLARIAEYVDALRSVPPQPLRKAA